MKAVAICGSPREGGNTEFLLQTCLDTLASEGIPGELIRLSGRIINTCKACTACFKSQDKRCIMTNDDFHFIFDKMLEADIIILGSPVYFGSATGEMKALLDRAGYVSRATW